MGQAIDFQVANLEHRAVGAASATQNGADTRGKLRKGEGLSQGIVGTGIEQADVIFRKARAGDHENRQVRLLRAYIAKNVEAAFSGQIEIQNYKIVRLVKSQTLGF